MSAHPRLPALLAVLVLDLLIAGYAYTQSKSEPKAERSMLLIGAPFGSEPTLTLDDSIAIETEGSPAVVSVAPVVGARAQVVAGDNSWLPLYIHGTTPKFFDVRDWKLDQGRMWTNEEQKGNANVCVLGRTVTNQLFGAESPLGKSIRVNSSSLKVIGTLTRRMGADAIGLDQDDIILAPLGTIKEKVKTAVEKPLPPNAGGVDNIYVRVGSEKEISAAVQQIKTILQKRHRIRSGLPEDFEIRYLGELVKSAGH